MATIITALSRLFGTTRIGTWADTQQPQTAAHERSGVILGAVDGKLLIDSGMNPVAVLGPCRSSKSTAFIVPTLLTWQESAIVTDVQGELHSLTQHWRRTGAHNDVRRLAFGDVASPDSFNFLDTIPRGPGELAEIQALAASLLDDGQDGGAVWHHAAQSLLSLFIIAMRPHQGAGLCDVQQAVADDAAFGATVAVYRDLIPDNELDHAATAAVAAYTALAEHARSAVRAMVAGALAIFASPDVARTTSRSSFSLAELRGGTAPMTVYLTYSSSDLGRLQPLLRAFLGQVVRHATQGQQQPEEAVHRMLVALDDFASLGRIDALVCALAYLPAYGIKPLLTIGDLAQLDHAYGKGNQVWKQCSVRAVLPVSNIETAAAVAKEIGSIVAPAGAANFEQRPGITPDEFMRLGKREAIIVGMAKRLIRASALPYYTDPGFKARVEAGNADPLLPATT